MREEMLDASVAQLADCVLSMRCHPGCERPGHLPLRQLVDRYGRLQLRMLLKQLRCSGCKRPPAQVDIADHIVDGQFSTFRVNLLP
jgi:hypothetical protein